MKIWQDGQATLVSKGNSSLFGVFACNNGVQ